MLGFSSIPAACHIARYLGIARDGDKNAGTRGSRVSSEPRYPNLSESQSDDEL